MKKHIEKLQQNSLKLTQPSTSSLEYKSHYKELYKFLDLKLGYWPLLVHFLIKSRVKEYIEKDRKNRLRLGQFPSGFCVLFTNLYQCADFCIGYDPAQCLRFHDLSIWRGWL